MGKEIREKSSETKLGKYGQREGKSRGHKPRVRLRGEVINSVNYSLIFPGQHQPE